jgi:hypothetical protein
MNERKERGGRERRGKARKGKERKGKESSDQTMAMAFEFVCIQNSSMQSGRAKDERIEGDEDQKKKGGA